MLDEKEALLAVMCEEQFVPAAANAWEQKLNVDVYNLQKELRLFLLQFLEFL